MKVGRGERGRGTIKTVHTLSDQTPLSHKDQSEYRREDDSYARRYKDTHGSTGCTGRRKGADFAGDSVDIGGSTGRVDSAPEGRLTAEDG